MTLVGSGGRSCLAVGGGGPGVSAVGALWRVLPGRSPGADLLPRGARAAAAEGHGVSCEGGGGGGGRVEGGGPMWRARLGGATAARAATESPNLVSDCVRLGLASEAGRALCWPPAVRAATTWGGESSLPSRDVSKLRTRPFTLELLLLVSSPPDLVSSSAGRPAEDREVLWSALLLLDLQLAAGVPPALPGRGLVDRSTGGGGADDAGALAGAADA